MKQTTVQDNGDNRKKCICAKCPSFPHDCSGEILYCSKGKSQCDINARGCICPGCPIYTENNLSDLYYCNQEQIDGSKNFMRKKRSDENEKFYHDLVSIKNISFQEEHHVSSMGSRRALPFSLNDLHFIPAQVYTMPLNQEEYVNTKIIIGPNAAKPLKLNSPILISGMSFGAVSKKVKLVISQAAKKLGIGFNSGEGGILEADYLAKEFLIGQYATGRFGINDQALKSVAAIEIRFGQGAYPGKGSFLPAKKMTAEVAKIRGLKPGDPAYSPAHHPDMHTPKDIAKKISWLKHLTGGVPVGAKIGCGNIEQDIKMLVDAGIDFLSIDGFGGGTGATETYARENVGIPLYAALPRAVKTLSELNAKKRISLIAGGGLRFAGDFAKCLALGADAVYIGTAALIAINCQQYRICHTGLCPTGITTHNPELTKQLNVEAGVQKLANFIQTSTQEIASFTRIVGKNDINLLNSDDLISLEKDLAVITGLKWLNGKSLF